eukprot:TRINITY_DN5438_c0_g1_i1.p1 TRINITY_DN5438_c0_g1~~TRINITY_DN5438_c0_g1_i1.p1  ORF type:complete len:532 (+),score=113.06 TRINITY_DN5438_c0_g1_i1:165-1598(+)
MHKTIPLVRPPSALKGVKCARLMEVLKRTKIKNEDLQIWGLCGRSIETSLQTVCGYIDNNVQGSSDAGERLRCITQLLLEKPEEYDVAKILLALAQNGSMCNVQKEIGIRTVYMIMTGTGKDDSDARGAQSLLLQILASLREVLAESQCLSVTKRRYYGSNNSHYLIPIRNSYCKRIGLPYVPDVHASCTPSAAESEKYLAEFMELYTPFQIMWAAEEAVNGDPKKIPYETLLLWYEMNVPKRMDKYEFLSEFVFDMDTGGVTKTALLYMLWRMGILEGTPGITFIQHKEVNDRYVIQQEYDAMWRLWATWQQMEGEQRFTINNEETAEYTAINTGEVGKLVHTHLARLQNKKTSSLVKSQPSAGGGKLLKVRLSREQQNMLTAEKKWTDVSCKPTDDSLRNWKLVLEGTGKFEGIHDMSISIPANYPLCAPVIKFTEPVPSITGVVVDQVVVFDSWTPKNNIAFAVERVMEIVRGK